MESQFILDTGTQPSTQPTQLKNHVVWLHPLAIPAYIVVASIALLLLQTILSYRPLKKLLRSSENELVEATRTNTQAGIFSETKEHVQRLGGWTIFSFRLVRLLSIMTLLGLSVTSFVFDEEGLLNGPNADSLSKLWGKGHKEKHRSADALSFTRHEQIELIQCSTYLYASFLALLSVTAGVKRARPATTHLVVILGTVFAVYVYRDLWPLLTFTKTPPDLRDESLLWAKLAVLGLEPHDNPNPEQTASILSMMLYNFLDPVVFSAYRVPHLSFEQLPPLADYDYTKYLVRRSFPHLDLFSGARKRHLFWGLMIVFRREYIGLAIMLVIRTNTLLLGPLAIYKLLQSLEIDGRGAVVRPWVWISGLFFGPMIGTIVMQRYVFLSGWIRIRTEGIFTHLLFEHALRIRMKAETDKSPVKLEGALKDSTVTVSTPNNASLEESSSGDSRSGSGDETANSSFVKVKSQNSKGKQHTGDENAEFIKDDTMGADNLVGKINNLASVDLNNTADGCDFLLLILYLPLQIVLCVVFLYTILGWSAFVGLASMVILFPFPGFISNLIKRAQEEGIKRTDARVQTVTETMNVLRMVKVFGWEHKLIERLAEKRDDELNFVQRRQLLNLLNNVLNVIIPVVTMIVTYVTYTIIMKQILAPSTVFSSISAKVSLDRITEFLHQAELLDSYAEDAEGKTNKSLTEAHSNRDVIGFQDATFTWANDSLDDGAVTPSRRKFVLNIEGELLFKRACINVIIGPTGSGKTSLLMALLGEMHFVPSGPGSWYSLPREGGVAYAAQESWVQNETIRDNILFGAPYDAVRYSKVVFQCGLERDLTLFEAGDQTEVGEKGLTLSGGQKARVTLARAIYSSAEIILLDDVLAALDVHTARWIVDKCFKGDLIRGRTVLLVTHNVAMASPIAEYVVSLGLDGKVASRGSVLDALAHDNALSKEVSEEVVAIEKADTEIDSEEPDNANKKADGKLTVAEEIHEGHVSWEAMGLYFKSLGGSHTTLFWIVFLGGITLCDLANSIQTWFLGYWAQQYEIYPPSEVHVSFYLSVYSLLLLFAIGVYSIGSSVYVFGAVRASRIIHRRLIESVLRTTLRWLDMTPTSRVITRCTQDIGAIDGPVVNNLLRVIEISATLLIKLAAVVVLTPVFVVPGILVSLLGGWCGHIYMRAQLSVKREMSNAKAPVMGHFGAAIAGLTSIRAYGAQAAFRQESYRRIDRYTRAGRTFYNLNRWVCVRIDALGGLFAAALGAWLVYGPGHSDNLPSDTGFSLTMAVGFSGMILWWVRCLNEFEVSGNSLERIQAYINIEQEPKATKDGVPPAYWPASGDVKVENLSARYSQDGPNVLHDISFHIKSGERVGVVGRTGSGKSSLTLSLLRCLFTDGAIYYDGLRTDSVNLDSLRTNITIIPQVPELLSGTLRENLDPFSEHDDATLNGALRAAGLFSLQSDDDEGRITLDTKISTGGGNLSVGQRQILALARAIVRGSKLLILDEATSAIDYETDSVIQSSLRHELRGDVTLITIAHRLQTIMDADKILVLDAGRIVEFDTPSALLKNDKGILRALVNESSDKETLYVMAKGEREIEPR
ncbi:ABC transporter [Heterobasidion irregulare TC 32-1]|uniref:ABC transporter n=1 Tax=Heterobasidion irregulare (strain TC 32-1) TaxID=747525 RepID=W4KQE3_HETIT|nr:ABC transporter [Heterobasidion irregulare TC 32-1]ETW87620.1 ABC transporter [Heterobasidion irregulare TC 32-1]